jgi:hypothetical protein
MYSSGDNRVPAETNTHGDAEEDGVDGEVEQGEEKKDMAVQRPTLVSVRVGVFKLRRKKKKKG